MTASSLSQALMYHSRIIVKFGNCSQTYHYRYDLYEGRPCSLSNNSIPAPLQPPKPTPMFTAERGIFSLISTQLYEQARDSILEHLGLSARTHFLLFSTPYRAQQLSEVLSPHRLALCFQRRPAPPAGHVRPGRAQKRPAQQGPLSGLAVAW